MSAASWFNPKMLPSFDCRTLERCSTARTPTAAFSPSCSLLAWSPPPQSDSFHYCRHIAPAKKHKKQKNVFISIQPPACHSRPAAFNAEQVTKCFSAEYSFHLRRALVFVDSVFFFPSEQPNCLKLQMLNIAQVPPPAGNCLYWPCVCFWDGAWSPLSRLSLLHCLPYFQAVICCYLLLPGRLSAKKSVVVVGCGPFVVVGSSYIFLSVRKFIFVLIYLV